MNSSRFTEALIKPELERVRRSIRGLRPDIKMQVQQSALEDYDENVKKAYWAEDSCRKV